MRCCHCSCLYRNLPFLHGLTGFFEMILGIVRIAIFFSPLSTGTKVVPKQYSGKYVAGFIIDWISSGVPTLVGLFTVLIIFVILYKLCACFLNVANKDGNEINTSGILRTLFRNKALRRFLIIDCNCPCYKARPRRRFQIRFILLFIFFILRITAIGLYATAPAGDNDGGTLAGVCALSLIFLFNTLCLDFYRYWVWWHYTP